MNRSIKLFKNNYIIVFLRSIRLALKTVKNFKKEREDLKFIHLIKFFIIRAIYGLTYFRNKIVHKKSLNMSNLDNFQTILNKNEIIDDLCVNGFCNEFKLNSDIKEDLLSELLKNLKNSLIILKNNSSETKNLEFSNKESINQFLIKKKVHIIKSTIDFKKCVLLKNIFLNEFFIKLAKDYLNCEKLTIIPNFFISAANQSIEDHKVIDSVKSSAAQEYHFDVDFKKFFKIFVYFTDVFDENDGAHIYIPKTHRKKNIDNILASRFKTSEINKKYNVKKVFLGKSGTTFIIDTFGIHKGSPVKKGTRMLLNLEFGRDHFPTQKECWYI